MPHPLSFVAATNRFLTKAWAKGWWPEPVLDSSALVAEACRRERVAAIPGRHWQEPFELLLDDLREHARLNPLGRQVANGQLVTLLRLRIRAETLLREHREIIERPLARPVIILGHMRSGTTRLHRLLAQDRRFAHTRLFESLEPVPRRGRRARAAVVQRFLELANPALAAVHPTHPLEPEEEFGLHSFSFHGAQFEAQWHVPGFAAFARERDGAVPYGEFATLLRIMGRCRGDDPAKPWLLKSPQFTGELQPLLRQFPDARLLRLNRDPAAVVGSSASLVWHQRRIHSDCADSQAIGAEWLDKTLWRERKLTAVLRDHRHVPQLPVDFDEVGAEWEAAVRRIYAFLDMPLTDPVLRRMRGLMARPPRHQGHHYRLEDFDLSEAGVREAFREAEVQPR
ncbi:sulfotransferase [uncultured Sphingomonas sp.]|uniref:sulfotransferase family protein n=1 Tax=uncultured Sphingomonas sp. TaxID=158754 RepID=UPI0025E7EA22|nr:sulfotransferase [uncultured Sphingomonas sp.]